MLDEENGDNINMNNIDAADNQNNLMSKELKINKKNNQIHITIDNNHTVDFEIEEEEKENITIMSNQIQIAENEDHDLNNMNTDRNFMT